MTATLQKFIDALRNELQQYGEMLALLDQQNQIVLQRGGEEIQQSVAAINSHRLQIQTAREQRHKIQRNLAKRLSQPETAAFALIIPLLPEQYRPLVKALVQENNELLNRVEQRAEQNRLMLQRSLDLMQEFIDSLSLSRSIRPPRSTSKKQPINPSDSLVQDALI